MKTPGTNIIKAFNAGVAPNRGAVFYLQNPTVRCGAVRCGAVREKNGKTAPHRTRTVAKYLVLKAPRPDRGSVRIVFENRMVRCGTVRCGFCQRAYHTVRCGSVKDVKKRAAPYTHRSKVLRSTWF